MMGGYFNWATWIAIVAEIGIWGVALLVMAVRYLR